MVIDSYLDAKYGDGGPGSGRFEPDPSEIHASSISTCQRKHFFRSRDGRVNEVSPYFELGRVFEMMYGAALAYEHDPSVTKQVLSKHPPWVVAEKSSIVRQDVNVTIEVNDEVSIIGEADWCVLSEGVLLNEVKLHADGSQTQQVGTAKEVPYDGLVEKVVETKTTKNLDWKKTHGADEGHKFQVYPYMKCFDSDAEIAYMCRNDWGEYVVPVELSNAEWMDVELRAQNLSNVMQQDEVPIPTPIEESDCKWCNFKEECKTNGGSKYV